MWIDKLAIYKFSRDCTEPNKKKKPLKMKNHLIADEMMKISKLESLVSSLKESWDCDYSDIYETQVQIRFVPEGTDREEQ